MDSITIIGIIAAAGSVAAVALVLGYLQKRRTKMPSVSLQSSLLVHEPQPDEMPYDVFISYSHADQHWVRNWLLPRLEAAGLRVCIDCRDFEIGKSILDNIEWAVDNSRHTLLVLTPAWVASEWARFESLLVATSDPAGGKRKLIPLVLKPCNIPRRIALLAYADFTQPSGREAQTPRLVADIRSTPSIGTKSHRIDAAVPGRATLGTRTKLTVQICLPDTPPSSPEGWPAAQKPPAAGRQSEPAVLRFPPPDPQTGATRPIRLKIKVETPDFAVAGSAEQTVEVSPDADSEPVNFPLIPGRTGTCQLTVKVFNADGVYPGAVPGETAAGETVAAPAHPVASLELSVIVEPPIPWRRVFAIAGIIAAVVIAVAWGVWTLLPRPVCQAPISAAYVLIRAEQDVKLLSDGNVVQLPVPEAHGYVSSQGFIELGGLAPGNPYHLTLNGKKGVPPNDDLPSVWPNGEHYWDFMSVTADGGGRVSNQELVVHLPGSMELCLGQPYSAKFFVKDAGYRTILGNDNFLFTVELPPTPTPTPTPDCRNVQISPCLQLFVGPNQAPQEFCPTDNMIHLQRSQIDSKQGNVQGQAILTGANPRLCPCTWQWHTDKDPTLRPVVDVSPPCGFSLDLTQMNNNAFLILTIGGGQKTADFTIRIDDR